MKPNPPKPITPVRAWAEGVVIPTYLPAPPDPNPMFLETRVYQGSSGRVYPLPCTDRIAERPVDRTWQSVWIENEFLRVQVLPEIGGRIHAILDKTNGYELIYRQHVIKPALVGLAGPWVSGGIEFNWPQHHRPATFLPVEFEIEEHPDGSRTIWCSDHDPLTRMKGMHGVCLHPERAYVELKVRAYNRTLLPQTFLWWANVATRVHEHYQSFFPPDVTHVADHARRSMSEYPLAQGTYYGVDYGARARNPQSGADTPQSAIHNPQSAIRNPQSNDLTFYANIPTPCSYMAVGSHGDFLGGYDHLAQAGLIHVANHHIAPGKKQWTWGNHPFGHAWDRNLTDPDAQGRFAPYIEIMAGVYTDNQPDFSFLQPGETRTWSQFWYPIQQIGPAQEANLDAAVCLMLGEKDFRIGVAVTRALPNAVIRLELGDGSAAAEWDADLFPGKPFVLMSPQARTPWKEGDVVLRVLDRDGRDVIACETEPRSEQPAPAPATEPAAPANIPSADELYLTGLHLDQYRHATRCPTLYWREALRRDPLDARCNNALGLWHLKRGEFTPAEQHFRQAIQRLTQRNANPYDGEPFYNLGLCLRSAIFNSLFPKSEIRNQKSEILDGSYAAFYKATWNQAWAGAGFHALAEIDCERGHWTTARDHLDRSLRHDTDNLRARNLKVLVLRCLGEVQRAESVLRETRALDPLDAWARHLDGIPLTCDLQVALDVAHDCARAGFLDEAVAILEGSVASPRDLPDQSWGVQPLVHYTLGWLEQRRGRTRAALDQFQRAATLPTDYCFPARLEEIVILQAAIHAHPRDARAPYYLGNLLYDRRQHEAAIGLWEQSVKLDPKCSIAWRNLGLGYYNVRGMPDRARAAYVRARRANPADARLLFEHDQLRKRLGDSPSDRLAELEAHPHLVAKRDDLSLELCALYNQVGQPERALDLIRSRRFQPWEGGEGGPLGQWVRAHLALGRRALARSSRSKSTRARDAETAREHFAAAWEPPLNLGEARHLLANPSDIHHGLGCALAALGDTAAAREHWKLAATFQGDFQGMRVQPFSELTYYSALSWERLGQKAKARDLLLQLLAHARELQRSEAKLDYFATSLPTMLLFHDNLQDRQEILGFFLEAQAWLGLRHRAKAVEILRFALREDPNHTLASDLFNELNSP